MKLQNFAEQIVTLKEDMNPISGQININSECVNTCRYCLKHTFPRSTMTLDTIKQLVSDFKKMGIKTLIVSGGEPFLHPDINEILEYLHSNEIGVSIITSLATPIDLNVVKFVKRINVSLDGINKEMYFKTRGKGDVELVKLQLTSLSALLSIYDFQLNIWTVHSKLNDSEIENIKTWVSSIAHTSYRINDLRTFDALKMNKDSGYTKNCWYSFINFIIDASGIVMNCCKLMHDNDDYKTINPDLVMGSIYENSFYDIWNSNRAKKIRSRIFEYRFKECAECDRAVRINDEMNEYFLYKDIKRGGIFL